MTCKNDNENNYPFFWLDELAEVILNPENYELPVLKPEELAAIRERLPQGIQPNRRHPEKSGLQSLYWRAYQGNSRSL